MATRLSKRSPRRSCRRGNSTRQRLPIRPIDSNRKRIGDEAGLLAFVASKCTDSRAGARVASGVGNFAAKERAQSRFYKSPCAHVLRLFLTPDELCALWKWLEHFAQAFFYEGIKLLDANDRRVLNFPLSAILQQIEINFSRTKNNALRLVGGTSFWRAKDLFEPAMNEFLGGRGSKRGAQQTLRRHYRSEERRVGKECIEPCRSRWSP